MSGLFPFGKVMGIGVPGFFGPKTTPTNVQSFTTAGAFTWTKPTPPAGKSILSITVTVIGAGGSAASGSSFTNGPNGPANGGYGGGGGGYASATYLPGAFGATVNGVVGAGGPAAASPGTQIAIGGLTGNNGTAGGASNFGAFITSTGGNFGTPTTSGFGGTGTVNAPGSPTNIVTQTGGQGGNGSFAVGSPARDGAVPTLAGAGGGSGGGQGAGGVFRQPGVARGVGSADVLDTATKPTTPTGGGGGGSAITQLSGYTGGLFAGDGANGLLPGDASGAGGTANANPGGGGATGGASGAASNGSCVVITTFG